MRSSQIIDALVDLVLPHECAGCGGTRGRWCISCASAVRAACAGPAQAVRPQPFPAGFPPTWAATSYDGVIASTLKAFKDGGRKDLAGQVAPGLRTALAQALSQDPVLARILLAGERLLVTRVPSRRAAIRERGRDPLAELVHTAYGSDPALEQRRTLRLVARTADQAGLDAVARMRNQAGSMAARAVRGRACVVVDDIVTTGATLVEARRALEEAGAAYVVAVAVAATARTGPRPANRSQPGR